MKLFPFYHTLLTTPKRIIPFILCTFLLLACGQREPQFTIDVLNKFTPIKDQGRSQTCWIYAMLAAIETEHIMRGDSVHLSVAFVESALENEPAAPKTKRGIGLTCIHLIQKYGLVPYDAMTTTDEPAPLHAYMHGCEYTVQEFARSVCSPDEYIALGSSSKHPYGENMVLDVPDNWEKNRVQNLPMNDLLTYVERAVRHGHGVCWEGDTSERGFSWKDGIAKTSLLNGTTTDDHCMAIVGLARDEKDKPYFIMKNSWGTSNRYHGMLFMSFDYFKKKTIAIYMPGDAMLQS